MLTSSAAAALDVELMSGLYTLAQLMELAGLAVALAAQDCFPLETHPTVLCLCGKGNNGGDGLVAARHLLSFGYSPTLLCPLPPASGHLQAVLTQCTALGIPLHTTLDTLPPLHTFSCCIDALLGFSASLPLRAPFAELMQALCSTPSLMANTLAVDVPTGWEINQGGAAGAAANPFQPLALISLTAPKPCAALFETAGQRHYLGLLNIVPPAMAQRYGLPQQRATPTPGLGGIQRLQ
jgi:NAD(P)H-hydrate epimerase